MKTTRRFRFFLAFLVLVGGASFVFVKLAWADGPPLWWVLRGSHVERVVVHWDKRKAEVTDARQMQEFYQAVLSGSAPLPYPTRCLPDEHPEDWSVTFIRSGQAPFQVQVGTDGCGTFYVPSVGSTYSGGELMMLIKKRLKIA